MGEIKGEIKPIEYTLGKAGFLAEKMESVIAQCDLQDEYETQLDLYVRNNTGDSMSRSSYKKEEFVSATLGLKSRENAEFRLQVSKDVIQNNKTSRTVIAACRNEEISPDLLKFDGNFVVEEPSILNTFKNVMNALGFTKYDRVKTNARDNLIGLLSVHNSMAVYRNKISPQKSLSF